MLPALAMAYLVSQEYRLVYLESDHDGIRLSTLLDILNSAELATLAINFIAIALVINKLSKLGYEGVFGCTLSSCFGAKLIGKKDNPSTRTATQTHRHSEMMRDCTQEDVNAMRGPSIVDFHSGLARSVPMGRVTFDGQSQNSRSSLAPHESAATATEYGNSARDGLKQSEVHVQVQATQSPSHPRSKSVTRLRREIQKSVAYAKHAPLPLFDLAKRLVWYPIIGSVAVTISTVYNVSQRSTIDQYMRTVIVNENPVQQTIQFYFLTIMLPLCGIAYGGVFVSIQKGAWEQLQASVWHGYCFLRYCGEIPPELLSPIVNPDDTGMNETAPGPKLIRTIITHRSIRQGAGMKIGRTSPSSLTAESSVNGVLGTRDSTASTSAYDTTSSKSRVGSASRTVSVQFDVPLDNSSYFDSKYGSHSADQDAYDYEYNDKDERNDQDHAANDYYSDDEEIIEEHWDFDDIDDLEAYIGKATAPDKNNSSSDMNVDIELASVVSSQTVNGSISGSGDDTSIPNIPVVRGPAPMRNVQVSHSLQDSQVEFGTTNPIYNLPLTNEPRV